MIWTRLNHLYFLLFKDVLLTFDKIYTDTSLRETYVNSMSLNSRLFGHWLRRSTLPKLSGRRGVCVVLWTTLWDQSEHTFLQVQTQHRAALWTIKAAKIVPPTHTHTQPTHTHTHTHTHITHLEIPRVHCSRAGPRGTYSPVPTVHSLWFMSHFLQSSATTVRTVYARTRLKQRRLNIARKTEHKEVVILPTKILSILSRLNTQQQN